MSEFFKSKNKFLISLSALFLAITLATGSFAYFSGDIAKPVSVDVTDEQDGLTDIDADMDTGEQDTDLPEEDTDPTPVSFNTPEEMRGTFLVPGVDFLKSGDTSEDAVKKEIDAAFESAQSLTMNTVIVDTIYNDQVVYHTADSPTLTPDFDILAYIVEKARQQDVYVYAIFDASLYEARQMTTAMAVGAGAINKLSANLGEFAETYGLDGILIDGYTVSEADKNYSSYINFGGGIGFDNFMRQSPAAIVKTASKAVHKSSPGTQVGLLADAVWENKSENEEGSATEATFTSLGDGNADTKGFVEKGYVDFVAVKAYVTTDDKAEPFEEVVNWWAGVAQESSIPMYVVHASSKLQSGEQGWQAQDQLVRQVATADEITGTEGSIFNDLQKLVSAQSVSDSLVKYFEDGVAPEKTASTPAATQQQSKPEATPAPAPAPAPAPEPAPEPASAAEESSSDDEALENVPSEYEILEEVSDTTEQDGDDTFDPDEEVVEDDTTSTSSDDWSDITETADDFDWGVAFTPNTATPIVAQPIPVVPNLGQIIERENYTGLPLNTSALLQIASETEIKDGTVVQVTADQAITYPPKTKDNIPSSLYYPLPKGARDTVTGKEVVYESTKDKKTFRYFVLESGMRVSSGDIKAISGDSPSGNTISSIAMKTDKDYTYITLKTAQQVTYSVKYASDGISFNFHNTDSAPGDMTLDKNPLFEEATWKDSTLTLSLMKTNAFMGYKGYFNKSGNLVLRFNNPPKDLAGARIAVDAGHGGSDPGNLGSNKNYHEMVINKLIADLLVEELESRGATVLMLNPDGIPDKQKIEGPERKAMAEKWQADLFVSVHCNSAPNKAAVGTEVFYFHPFSKGLATASSKTVSSELDSTNRGAKQSYYHVSLSSQFQSVLVECGFMSNAGEYKKLLNEDYQKKIASGIADGLETTIKNTYTGVTMSGSSGITTTSTSSSDDSDDSDDSSSSGSGSGNIEAIYIQDSLSILTNRKNVLVPSFYPEDSTDKVTWKSSKSDVATVDDNGLVTAKKEGSTRITVTSSDGSQSAVCQVTVKSSDSSVVRVKSVELSETSLVLSAKETAYLVANITPSDADDTYVIWKSNRPNIATVGLDGKVTGVKEGEATITAVTAEGSKRATCAVTVSGVAGTSGTSAGSDSGVSLKSVSDAYFDYGDITVYPGNSRRLEVVSNRGEIIKGSDFEWASDDTDIATVDSKGWVTGKKVGDCIITATANDYVLDCSVFVSKDKIKVTGVSLNKDSILLSRGKSYDLEASLSPEDATTRNLTWSSDKTGVATVDGTGRVTGKAPGTAVITVKTKEGSYTAKCTVEVSRTALKIEELYLEDELEYYVGDTDQLEPEIYPDMTTDQALKWKSSNPSVVTVDDEGNIEMLKRGTATITVSATGTSAKATCKITVLSD